MLHRKKPRVNIKCSFSVLMCIGLLVSNLPVQAQSDSVTFVNTPWNKTKIAKGVILKQYWFNQSLFGASQNINILEITIDRHNRLDIEGDPQILQPTSAFGAAHRALAAVNGTFFDMKNGGSVDYIRIDGSTLNETRQPVNNKRAFHQRSAVVVNNGRLYIKQWDSTAQWESQLPGEDVVVTGPMLISGGERSLLDSITFNTARHPRTAVALLPNKVLLITIDGRNERAAGMSLFELASVLKWLSAEEGINLDGGGSTTMWIEGFPFNGVVNYPSDNKALMQSPGFKKGTDPDNIAADLKKWDHSGERPVANVILVSKSVGKKKGSEGEN